MSYDSFHALRGARNGVTDSIWTPMVSYVWRFMEIFSPHPSAMHFSQVFLLLLSLVVIVHSYSKRISYAAVFLIAYLSIPVILGSVAVIWKDVLMAAFFIAAFAVMGKIKTESSLLVLAGSALLAATLLFLGVCVRHNAITGAVPLFVYLLYILFSRFRLPRGRLLTCTILSAFLLAGLAYYFKTLLDTYAIPDLHRLSNGHTYMLRAVKAMDIAGASTCVNQNLFAEAAPHLTLKDIKSGYDPKHINLSSKLIKGIRIDRRIDKLWFNVLIDHPICFFYNKYQLAKYLSGAHKGGQFYITHPFIDPNEFGYRLPESNARDTLVEYIVNNSRLFFFKPVFIYSFASVMCIVLCVMGRMTVAILSLWLSALFYFAGLVLFGNAADARLLFYTTTAIVVVIFLCGASAFREKFENNSNSQRLPDSSVLRDTS